jgi:hypothetical protein
MKKEVVIFGGLLVVVVLLVVMIVMAVNPGFFIKMGFEPWGTPILIKNWIADLGKPKNASLPCPSELQVFYAIERNGTEGSYDDSAYIRVNNLDKRNFLANIYVNNYLEGNVMLKASATAELESKLITEWWRSGNQSDERSFSVDIRINGCNKTLAELAPSLPRPANAGGGGGGGSGGSSGGGGDESGTPPPDEPREYYNYTYGNVRIIKRIGVLPD